MRAFEPLEPQESLDLDENLGRDRTSRIILSPGNSHVLDPTAAFRATSVPVAVDNDIDLSQRRTERPVLGPSLEVKSERRKADHRATSEPSQHVGSVSKQQALRPLDTNARLLPRTSGPQTKRRKRGDGGASAIHHLSEDGEDLQAANTKAQRISFPPENEGTKDPSYYNKLKTLLSERSPQRSPKTPLAPTRTPITKARLLAEQENLTPGSITPKQRQPWPAINAPRSRKHDPEPNAIDPSSEPFRALPPKRMGEHHFKFRPSANRGYNYAFSEVERNKAARKCLPGCIDPRCCGPLFRAMALNAPPLAIDEEMALLDDYLGDDRQKAYHMSEQDRKETLLKARTRDMANRHGKMHRHLHRRGPSPPGYWESEFPSTQEEKERREEADRRLRERVDDMRREAFRPDGVWMFADE